MDRQTEDLALVGHLDDARITRYPPSGRLVAHMDDWEFSHEEKNDEAIDNKNTSTTTESAKERATNRLNYADVTVEYIKGLSESGTLLRC